MTHKAFTLVELLVVISIIALLSSIGVASLNTARSKARDAKRTADLKNISTALDLYYDKYDAYLAGGLTTTAGTLQTSGLTEFMTVPIDPLNQATKYGYYYAPGYSMTGPNSFNSNTLGTQSYVLATKLEKAGVSALINQQTGGFGGWDNVGVTGINYMIGK